MLDHLCCRHLYGSDRMLIAWPAEDHAIVIAIGRHDGSAEDVYATLLAALDLTVPAAERLKPPCCDGRGQPPANEVIAVAIVDAIARRKTRRAP